MLLRPFLSSNAPVDSAATGEVNTTKPARWRVIVSAVTVSGLLAACGGGDPAANKPQESPSVGATVSAPDPKETEEPEPFAPVGKVTLGPAQVVLQDLSQITGLTVLGPDEYLLINGRTGQLQWAQGQATPQPVQGPAAEHLQLTLAQAKDDLVDREFAKNEGGNQQAAAKRPLPQVLDVITSPTFADDQLLYFFVSTGEQSKVISAKWQEGSLEPGADILTGLPAGAGRNGGALGFGPDGYLYISVGDTGMPELAQDPISLAGKILRVAADGATPGNNPMTGSLVWSLGHRNVTAMAWTQDGQMYAVEQGEVVADELNLILPGANYGWPLVEGRGNTETTDGTAPQRDESTGQDSTKTDGGGQTEDPGTENPGAESSHGDPDLPGDPPQDGGTPGEATQRSLTGLDVPAVVDQLTMAEAAARGFTAPSLQWDWSAGHTTAGDPVSLVATSEGLYVAGFHSERLWRVGLLRHGLGLADEFSAREFGPLGQVALSADNVLLVLATSTNPSPGTGSISLPLQHLDEATAPHGDSLLEFMVTY